MPGSWTHSRIQFLEVSPDQVILRDLDKHIIIIDGRDEITLGLDGSIVDLANDLDGKVRFDLHEIHRFGGR